MLDLSRATYSHQIDAIALRELKIDSLVFGADLLEDRSAAVVPIMGADHICKLHLTDDHTLEVNDGERQVSLYEEGEIAELLESLPGTIALDLTGLEHKVWATLVRIALSQGRELIAIYAEPDDYQKSIEPLPGEIYDLSQHIQGIEPLPGFARVVKRNDDRGFFAPMLGFEGARLAYVMDQEDVDIRNTYPIIGFPGFRIEYPAHAFLGNRQSLTQDHLYRRVELARASCPFEAYQALKRVSARAKGSHLRIAPIGTKPHALGAILFAIANPESVEIIYDHPSRSKDRTRGVRSFHVYDVSAFVRSEAR